MDDSQTVSYTPILDAITTENITAVYPDITDLAASFTVYKIGEFVTYSIAMVF